MKICNIDTIYDSDEFVTIVTKSGTVVHLPRAEHSITLEMTTNRVVSATIDLYINGGDELE